MPKRLQKNENQPNKNMLYTIALILIIAWLLGLVSSYTLGGFIHILLVVAIIVLLVRVIQGRKVKARGWAAPMSASPLRNKRKGELL
jgi:hypothetical protein